MVTGAIGGNRWEYWLNTSTNTLPSSSNDIKCKRLEILLLITFELEGRKSKNNQYDYRQNFVLVTVEMIFVKKNIITVNHIMHRLNAIRIEDNAYKRTFSKKVMSRNRLWTIIKNDTFCRQQ